VRGVVVGVVRPRLGSFRAAIALSTQLVQLLLHRGQGLLDVGFAAGKQHLLLVHVAQGAVDGLEILLGHCEALEEPSLHDHVLNLLLLAEQHLHLALHVANVCVHPPSLLHVILHNLGDGCDPSLLLLDVVGAEDEVVLHGLQCLFEFLVLIRVLVLSHLLHVLLQLVLEVARLRRTLA